MRLTRVYLVSYINNIMQKLSFASAPFETKHDLREMNTEPPSLLAAADIDEARSRDETHSSVEKSVLIQYDRDFLLNLRFMPICTRKPHGLPADLEIVLNESHVPIKRLMDLDLGRPGPGYVSVQRGMSSIVQRNWEERIGSCRGDSYNNITELHLQLLPPRSVRTLYTVLGYGFVTVKSTEGSEHGGKIHQFIDLDDNVVLWKEVVKLLTNVQLHRLNLSSWKNFQHVYKRLMCILTDGASTSSILTAADLLQLPESVLMDLSVLRGVGYYIYGKNYYIHKGEGVNDVNVLASRVLSTGLTKADFMLYIENVVQRLDTVNTVKVDKLNEDWEERMTSSCSSSYKFSELHLQLLPTSSIKKLCWDMFSWKKVNTNGTELKIRQFVDLANSNVVEWKEVVEKVLDNVQLQDLDCFSLREFHETYKMLKCIKDIVTNTAAASSSSEILMTQDLIQLPLSVLRDLSVLRGVGCYRYSENCYVSNIHGDEKDMASHILATGLSKADFIVYIDNLMRRLDVVNNVSMETLQSDWEERITGFDFDKLSEFHLQLLTPTLVRNLYVNLRLGFVEGKWEVSETIEQHRTIENYKIVYQFLDLESNVLQFRVVAKKLLSTVQLNNLNEACYENFQETYEMLNSVMDELTYGPSSSSNVLTAEDILLLPTRVLRDLTILRGVTFYHYKRNFYVYEVLSEIVHSKNYVAAPSSYVRHQWASLLLLTDLTKADFVSYVGNMMQRLDFISHLQTKLERREGGGGRKSHQLGRHRNAKFERKFNDNFELSHNR